MLGEWALSAQEGGAVPAQRLIHFGDPGARAVAHDLGAVGVRAGRVLHECVAGALLNGEVFAVERQDLFALVGVQPFGVGR
ncbi:hypothetical protein [Pseudomonas sp. H2_H03]